MHSRSRWRAARSEIDQRRPLRGSIRWVRAAQGGRAWRIPLWEFGSHDRVVSVHVAIQPSYADHKGQDHDE